MDSITPSARSEKSGDKTVGNEQVYPRVEKKIVDINGIQLALVYDSIYIYSGDIILADWQVEMLRNPEYVAEKPDGKSDAPPSRALITKYMVRYWPGGRIPYTINSNFTAAYKANITVAIAKWEAATSIRFAPKTTSDKDYVEFVMDPNSWGAYSKLGKIGGKQQIVIGRYGSMSEKITHEIGHAIGLDHEHCRHDRGNYITIIYNNIASDYLNQFETESFTMDVGEFDFNSVMLYDSWGGTIDIYSDDYPTMLDKNGNTFDANRHYISSGDAYAVEAIYNPEFIPVYDRIETSLIEHNSQNWGPTWESDQYIYKNTIYFYTDATYTQRTTTPRRILRFNVQLMERDSPYSSWQTTEQPVVIPPGASHYDLDDTRLDWEMDYGNYIYYYHSQYLPLN